MKFRKLLPVLFLLLFVPLDSFGSSYTAISTITPRSRATSAAINDFNNNVKSAFDLLPDETLLDRGTVTAATDTGVANAYIVSLSAAPSGYVDNLHVAMLPIHDNTGASTINVNSLGVVSIKSTDGTSALSAGDIVTGVPISMRYSTVTGAFHVALSSAIASEASDSAAAAAASALAASLSESNASTSEINAAASASAASDSADFANAFAGDFSYPDYAEPDQGVTGSSKTLKYYVDQAGSDQATIVCRNNSGGATTEYTLTTSLTIPSNITLKFERGAIIDGAGTLTINGTLEAGAYQIFDSTVTVAGLNTAYPEWWTENTTPGTTDMTTALNSAYSASSPVAVIMQSETYFITGHVYVPRQTSVSCDGIATIKSTNGTSSVIFGTAGESHNVVAGHMSNVSIIDTDYDYKASSVGYIFGGISAVDANDRVVTSYDMTNVRVEGFDIGMVSFNRVFDAQFQDCVWNRNNYNVKLSQQGRRGGIQARFIGGRITNARKLGYWVYGGSVDAMDVRFIGTYIQNNGLDTSLSEGAIKFEANDDSGEGGTIGVHSFIGCHISNGAAQDVSTIESDEGTIYITKGLLSASNDTNPGVSGVIITGGYIYATDLRYFASNAAYGFETTGADGGAFTNVTVSGGISGVWDVGSSTTFYISNLTGHNNQIPGSLTVRGNLRGAKEWIDRNRTTDITLTVNDTKKAFLNIHAAITVTLPAVSTIMKDNETGCDIVFYCRDFAEVSTIKPNAADKINLYGVILDAGDTIDSAGGAGDWIRLISSSTIDGVGTDGWIALVGQGTFVDGGAP